MDPPDGLMRALSWDLSPMRPDEHGRADAARWTEAINLVGSYREGAADVEQEAAGQRRAASD